MSFWLILIPFISALLGWGFTGLAIKMLFHPQFPRKIMGYSLQGFLPKRRFHFSVLLANIVSRQLDNMPEIEKKLLDAATLQKIMPEIEEHIDHFLRVKLKDAMPMVAMFVGDKTIVQLKEVFMTEMQALFPVIMESYVKEIKKDLNIRDLIADQLDSIPGTRIESFLLQLMRKEIGYVQVSGAVLGFVIGAFQVVITLLINH